MQAKESEREHRTQVISFLGVIASSISVVVAAKSSSSIQIIVLTTAILIAAYSISIVFWRPLVRGIAKTQTMVRDVCLAPKYIRRVEDLVGRLRRLSSDNHTDSVACILSRFPGLWGGGFRGPVGLNYIAQLLDDIEFMLSKSRRNKRALLIALKWFDLTVNIHNGMCIRDPVREISNRSGQGIPPRKRREYDRLKRDYHKARSGYLTFLEDYMKLSREMSGAFHEPMGRDWIDKPDELPDVGSFEGQ